MTWLPRAFLLLMLTTAATRGSEEFFDRIADALVVNSAGGTVRARLSGTLDLEYFRVQAPAPGLIFTPDESLFNPRLTLFADVQLGSRVYVFAQARADRGFDPGRGGLRGRLDEIAVRFTPFDDPRLSLQAGKFATAVGNWVSRHGSWENPFVTAPLPYEHLTGIWDSVAAPSSDVLLAWAHVKPTATAREVYADKRLRLPIIWGPSYAPGFAVFGETGDFSFAIEVKSAALPSRPKAWKFDGKSLEHPTLSARVTYRPNVMWRLGVSASSGTYLRPSAAATVAPGHGLGDYRQVVLGQEISFAWHHWQVWAEAFQARFEIPRVGDVTTFSGYAEVKYRFTPRLSGAVRWNTQTFGTVPHGAAGHPRWGRDVHRIDIAPVWRFSAHVHLKLQFSAQHEDGGPAEDSRTVATQLTVRF